MATSKGTKMPRGDKKAIMEYEVSIYPERQEQIVYVLDSLDENIKINAKINKNLYAA